MYKRIFLTLVMSTTLGLSSLLPLQAKPVQTFDTQSALYTVNEGLETFLNGEEMISFEDYESEVDKNAYLIARHNVEHVFLASGMGVHLDYAPYFLELADRKSNGFRSSGQALSFKLNQFRARAGLDSIPANMYPIYLPFSSGTPLINDMPKANQFGSDYKSLRWPTNSFNTTLDMSNIGFGIRAATLSAEDLMGKHRGRLLGRTPIDGFRGSLMTMIAINGLLALKKQFTYDGRLLKELPEDKETRLDQFYWPHQINVNLNRSVENIPAVPISFTVKDRQSHLHDLGSLLAATSEFYYYSDPLVYDNYDHVFRNDEDLTTSGALFDNRWHELAGELSRRIFKTIENMHFNEDQLVLVDRAEPGYKFDKISVKDSSMIISGLHIFRETFHDYPELRRHALKLIVNQANFLMDNMNNSFNGLFYDSYNLRTNVIKDMPVNDLETQAQGIYALALSYKASGDEKYLKAAQKATFALTKNFWNPVKKVFHSRADNRYTSTITASSYGAVLGALTSVILIADDDDWKKGLLSLLDAFTETLLERQLQLLPETEADSSENSALDEDEGGDEDDMDEDDGEDEDSSEDSELSPFEQRRLEVINIINEHPLIYRNHATILRPRLVIDLLED